MMDVDYLPENLVVVGGSYIGQEVPDGIDAVVPMGATEQLLKKIQELLNPGQAKSKAAS